MIGHELYRDTNCWCCTGDSCLWTSDAATLPAARAEWIDAHAEDGEEPPAPPAGPRLTRDHMMMKIATVVAERSTCSRLHVGAVIARDSRAVVTGYNGNPGGLPHCEHVDDTPCTTAVHAEANAIAFAARHGVAVEGADLFTTHQPCLKCAQLIVNSGIARVVYDVPYRDIAGLDLLNALGIATMMLSPYQPGVDT